MAGNPKRTIVRSIQVGPLTMEESQELDAVLNPLLERLMAAADADGYNVAHVVNDERPGADEERLPCGHTNAEHAEMWDDPELAQQFARIFGGGRNPFNMRPGRA